MSTVRSVLHLIAEAVRFGRATQRTSLALVLLIGLFLLLLSLAAQLVAPLALYPFA